MKNRRGRPKIEEPKSRQYRLRLTEKEYEKLEYLAIRKKKTMADVLREGLTMVDNLDKYSY